MRLLSVLFILTSIDAKRRRLNTEQVNIKERSNNNGVDVYPQRFGEAVDFGHVYRNEDRRRITNIEPDMIEPRSREHARQLLKKIGSDIAKTWKPEEPLGFANPRDALQYERLVKPVNTEMNFNNAMNRPSHRDNITKNMRKSVEEEIKKKYPGPRSKSQENAPPEDIPSRNIPEENDDDKERFFSRSGFNLISEEKQYVGNWTTCKEFGKGALFYPDDVVNMQWVPFFIWSTRRFLTAVVHTFKYPTKKLVKRYKEEFGPYLDINVDWEQPKLLLKETKDMLLVAGDRKGLFYGIPYIELPSPTYDLKIKLTVITIRLKIVDPYLAMMFCNENYATIMSVAGTGPETNEEKTAEAAILKFHGIGNPVTRDLELEAQKSKFEIERKRKEEETKYIKVERPDDRLDPSLW